MQVFLCSKNPFYEKRFFCYNEYGKEGRCHEAR